jgi:ABC-type nitrate/sulfonate/bicarbonate transport system permease component
MSGAVASPDGRRAGAIFGLGPLATFLRIILPSSVIYVVAGMRSAIGFAFVAIVQRLDLQRRYQ